MPPQNQSKKAKGGIAGDAPSGVDQEAVPWRDVWAAMKRSGWSWKGGSIIMTDYYYIKPKCRVQGGLSGQDYFVHAEDAMEFVRDCYGWHKNAPLPTSHGELLSRTKDHARHCGERVPPLLGNNERNTTDKYTPLPARGGGAMMPSSSIVGPGATLKGDDARSPCPPRWTIHLKGGAASSLQRGGGNDAIVIDCRAGGDAEGGQCEVALSAPSDDSSQRGGGIINARGGG